MAEVRFTVSLEPDEIVTYLDENDDAVFAFVWEIINDERLGVELRERLLEQLKEELKDVSHDGDVE